MIWLYITAVLSMTSVISGKNFNTSHIRVFPAVNQTIAGVFQVSFLNHLHQPQYAFNASEARMLCSSLGVDIASKEQVKEALGRGLETCRFGWIDEHLAVIPRIKALSNCGKSQTGLVTWRTSVTQKFDVFCFNETDAATQLKDTKTDSPLSGRDHSGQTSSTQTTNTKSSSSSTSPPPQEQETIDIDSESVRFIGSEESSAEVKTILIASACALLLIAIIILVSLKLRSCSHGSDTKQQPECVETEDWTCVKERKEDVQEDERIQVDAS